MLTPQNDSSNNQLQGIKFNETKTYNLNSKGETLALKISTNEKLIFLEMKKLNTFPQKDYNIYLSLEELIKINKFFNQFETTSEILSSFEILIESKNISVTEKENQMQLCIINPVNKKEFYIDIPLKEKDMKSEINSINQYISSLNNKINELEKKVNDLLLFKEEYLKKKQEKKLNFANSDIIKSKEEIELIMTWLNKKNVKTNLLFNSKNDGDLNSTFFNKVENKSPTLIIINSDNGYKFGGYTNINWKSDGNWYDDKESFIFSLNNKSKYNADSGRKEHIFGYDKFFQFGKDIRIYNKCTSIDDNFVGKRYYNSPNNYEMNGGKQNFRVLSYEVYQII